MVTTSDEDYDPHLYREVDSPTNNWETFVHFLKGCLGTGILAMPEAFKHSGILCGIAFTCLVGNLIAHCVRILVKSQYKLCQKLKIPILSYPESMQVACENGPTCFHKFGPTAKHMTDIFLIFTQMGVSSCYIIFMSVSIKAVLDEYLQEKLNVKLYMCALFVPLLLIMSVRNLKLLVPFSGVATIVALRTYGVVFYYIMTNLPNFSDLPAVGPIEKYPLYFGTTIFALQSIGVMVTIENNMKTPKSFLGLFGILNIGMFSVTVLYIIMAVFGYWRFGEDIKPSVTLNFPPSETLSQVVNILYALVIYVSFGLQGYVGVYYIWNDYVRPHLKDNPHQMFWNYSLRLVFVIIVFLVALIVPHLGLFISLVGSFCLTTLVICFPAFLEICAHWPDELGPFKCVVIKNVLLIGFGLVALFSGVYSCIKEIIAKCLEHQL